MKTIALFGASGRTGQHVLAQALEAGYSVRVLARRPDSIRLSPPTLTVIEGDVLNPSDVERTVDGADVVVSVFGHVKGSPATVQTDGTGNIMAAMKKHGLKRIVSLSGGGLRFEEKDKPKVPDTIIRLLLKLLSPAVLRDAEGHGALLKASDLDWTIVRGPMLTDGVRAGQYRVGWVGVNASRKIARADLAAFILSQVTDDSFYAQLPFVSY